MEDVLDADRGSRRRRDRRLAEGPDGPVRKRVAEAIGKIGENMAVPRLCAMRARATSASTSTWAARSACRWSSAGVTPEIGPPRRASRRSSRRSPCRSRRRVRRTCRAARCPADVLDKERSIYRAQMEGSGKPANVIDKIVEGKLGSFYGQVVLTEQPWVRDPKADDRRRRGRRPTPALGAAAGGHAVRAASRRRSGRSTL